MFHKIEEFIKKLPRLRSRSHEEARIAEALSKELAHNIEPRSVSLRGAVLFVSVSPILRSELALKKPKLLQALSSLGMTVTDIR
jgi:hypothetical protein